MSYLSNVFDAIVDNSIKAAHNYERKLFIILIAELIRIDGIQPLIEPYAARLLECAAQLI